MSINKNGGVYSLGHAYSTDIYSRIENILTTNILVSSREVACVYEVGKSYVCNVKNKLLRGELAAPKPKGGAHNTIIGEAELAYIFSLYNDDNAKMLEEYKEDLRVLFTPQLPPSISTISRVLNKHLVLPRKKLTWIEQEKYTPENMQYYADFVGVLAGVNPVNIKSFDECHVDRSSKYQFNSAYIYTTN